jgi:hypothetical protein
MRSSIRKQPAAPVAPAPVALVLVVLLVAASILLGMPAADAAKAPAERYLRPDYASFHVRTIAILPVATLSPVPERGRENNPFEIVGIHQERALAETGYRFVTQSLLRSTARAAGADSAVGQLMSSWQTRGEMDSTALKAIGTLGVADAGLASMVTVWDRSTIDPSVTGQSMTQIGVRMALYSTRTGELLWRDTFMDKGEGPYNNPDENNVTGMSRTGLTPTAQTATSLEPPTYDDVAVKLEKKIRSGFPPVPKPAASTPAPPTP